MMKKMRLKQISLIGLVIVTLIFSRPIYSQTVDYKTEMSKDGKVEVSYYVGDRIDKNGEKVQLLDYVATTTLDIPIEKCVGTMRDVSSHKIFMGNTEESKQLKSVSENEWLAYYLFDPPWPMPDNDCVMRIRLETIDDGKVYTFYGETAPDEIDRKDVQRLEYYEYIFSFTEKEDKQVEFSIAIKLTPVGAAPNWMTKTWFPKGPVEFMEKFDKLAKE